MVQLKVNFGMEDSETFNNFNSSMVQLKGRLKQVIYTAKHIFQFQYGAAESPKCFLMIFHFFYFNSSMVQLKEIKSLSLINLLCYFNSSMVQLKGSYIYTLTNIQNNFNSSMVQLKAC